MTAFLGAIYSQQNHSLATLLNTTHDLTIFIPNNLALETVSNALTSMQNSTSLIDLLSYHILISPSSTPIYSSDFQNATSLTMLNGATADLTFFSNSYFLNSARLLTTDILIANGVIHMLDNVLSPAHAAAQPNPTSATQAPVLPTVAAQGFNSSIAPFTTYLPDYIAPAMPTTTTTSSAALTGSEAGTRTTSGALSTVTSTQEKKSGAGRSASAGWSWPAMGWLVGGALGVVHFVWI